ncbi:hypothetical protein PJI16_07760 [Nitrospira sp. MA-1]|nr:hypothetical protein [Nitrospira sp. MA-1]
MRKAHGKVLPLGALVFVLVMLGGVFPSMAQATVLTINFAGSGTGRVEANSPGTDTLNIFASNTLDYDQNSSVTLTAAPTGIGTSQSIFSSWAGCANTSGDQCTVVMDAAKAVTVTFNLVPVSPPVTPPVNLSVNFAGTGTGQVAGSGAGTAPFTIFNSQTIPYDVVQPPSSVTLTATPTGLGASQSTFAGWSGAGCTGTGTCTVSMSAARTVTATFIPVQRTLTVTKIGTGTVTSNPPGISCGNDCTEDYANGTSVTLAAVPTAGSTFGGWSGSGCTGTGTCIVSMTAARAVTATFTPVQRTLTVTKIGTGTVTSNPPGISCGNDCTGSYANGTPVTLMAVASAVSTFEGWSGSGCTGTGTCVVTMTAAHTVTATFTTVQETLTVTKGGTGSGTVTSNPAGIACGNDCIKSYTNGTSVTLTAVANAGSTFGGWSGSGCTGTGTCNVSMTAGRTVTATFTTVQETLTVTKGGTGSGTVTSNPGGIFCGNDCTEGYANGTPVTLTAVASAGSTFGGWSGSGCDGTGTGTCTVSMTAARTVTATFTQNPGNQPPSVNAGPSITIALPNTAALNGTVTDDGLPATPGTVTSTWSKVSGPGTVTFANASALSTTASFSEAGTYVLRLTATDGEFGPSSELTITANNAGARRLSNDLNADGTADLLWRNSLNGLVVGWLMKDAAVTTTGVLGGVPSNWQIMGMGDVNADGQADVIWRNTTTGVVAVWFMDGLAHTSTSFPGSASLSYVIKGIGDVDGNGTADLIWHNKVNGSLAIWLMNGSTIAQSGFPGSAPVQWEIVGVGDVDADERADVIWRNTTTGAVAVWFMDGLTHKSTGFPGSAPLNYVIKEIGDVDGNGTADIVWHHKLNGSVAIWIMNGPTVAFVGFPGGVPLNWQITGMGDVNADGQDDVIWQNRASGAVALWLMNGKDVMDTKFPRGTSTDWEIQ